MLLIVVGAVIVTLEAAGLWFVVSRLDFGRDKVLDVTKAQAGVQAVLMDPTDGYGLTNIAAIVCNDGKDPTIAVGASFTCDIVVGGKKQVVTVVFRDDDGTYEVDRPR